MLCAICRDNEQGTWEDEETGEVKSSPFCDDCGRMVSNAAKKRDKEVGSGPIKTTEPGGRWVSLESHQQAMFMAKWSDPTTIYSKEDEDEFTDIDLFRLSYNRMRRALDKRGFTDVPWDEIEDCAQDVMLSFVEAIQDKDTVIRSLHGYHWSLVNIRVKKKMMDFVERRKANISLDALEFAETNKIRDPYNWGATEDLERHRIESPSWMNVTTENLTVVFDGAGVKLTPAEMRTLRNALLGQNKGMKGRRSTRKKLTTVMKKIGDSAPQAYLELSKMLGIK